MPLLAWIGTEGDERKPWWWWFILSVITATLTAWAWTSGEHSVAVLVAVVALTIIALGTTKPRHFTYRLEGNRLQRKAEKVTELDLLVFDRCRPERIGQTETLALMPKARFGLPQHLYLPVDSDLRDAVVAAITALVPMAEADSARPQRTAQRIIDWLARKVRL